MKYIRDVISDDNDYVNNGIDHFVGQEDWNNKKE